MKTAGTPLTTAAPLATALTLLLLISPVFGATITVDTTADTDLVDGGCSLREAIFAANLDSAHNDCPAGNGADRIVFSLPTSSTILLTSSLPVVTETLAIRGPQGGGLSIDGAALYRHLNLDSATDDQWFAVSDLTLRSGRIAGAIARGGAIALGDAETLEVARVLFKANQADVGGGAVFVRPNATATFDTCTFDVNKSLGAQGGGAILSNDNAFVHILDSALLNNVADGTGSGGALAVIRGQALVERSTFSGNSSVTKGGGAIAAAGSVAPVAVAIFDSTITGNTSGADGGPFGGDGGGLFITGGVGIVQTLTLRNTIIAGNHDNTPATLAPDVNVSATAVMTSASFNLIGNNNSSAATFPDGDPNVGGNFVGTNAQPRDPLLGVLAENGGPTLTRLPLIEAATRVIDHGECTGVAADQRGYGDVVLGIRIVDEPSIPTHVDSDGCDIGAVERGGATTLPSGIFADGFEVGHTLRWSIEVP